MAVILGLFSRVMLSCSYHLLGRMCTWTTSNRMIRSNVFFLFGHWKYCVSVASIGAGNESFGICGGIARSVVRRDISLSTNKVEATHLNALNVWFADLPTEDCPDDSVIEFTFFWKTAQRWEDRNYSVVISGPK